MGGTWWSSADAEYLTLAEEHAATGGDHFGTVQTGCPICLREERDPPMRICPACGLNEAAEGDRYCPGCGSAPDRSSWIDGPRGSAHV